MNWYKIFQQRSFDFWNEGQRHQSLDRRPESLRPTPQLDEDEMSFDEAVEQCESMQELVNILKFYADNYEFIDFPNQVKIVMATINGKSSLIEISDSGFSISNPQEWLQDISWKGNAYEYVNAGDFSKEFWEGMGQGYTLYHGTTEENAESIEKQGINPGYQTRGINNRSTGAAVFASDSPDTAEYYYDAVFAIDVGAMKANGYMPEVSMEEPVQEAEYINALAHKIGLEDYEHETEQGLDPGTVIFYGPIPAKYLKKIK